MLGDTKGRTGGLGHVPELQLVERHGLGLLLDRKGRCGLSPVLERKVRLGLDPLQEL